MYRPVQLHKREQIENIILKEVTSEYLKAESGQEFVFRAESVKFPILIPIRLGL